MLSDRKLEEITTPPPLTNFGDKTTWHKGTGVVATLERPWKQRSSGISIDSKSYVVADSAGLKVMVYRTIVLSEAYKTLLVLSPKLRCNKLSPAS